MAIQGCSCTDIFANGWACSMTLHNQPDALVPQIPSNNLYESSRLSTFSKMIGAFGDYRLSNDCSPTISDIYGVLGTMLSIERSTTCHFGCCERVARESLEQRKGGNNFKRLVRPHMTQKRPESFVLVSSVLSGLCHQIRLYSLGRSPTARPEISVPEDHILGAFSRTT